MMNDQVLPPKRSLFHPLGLFVNSENIEMFYDVELVLQ